MICIMNDDIYPQEEWNYVFGLANLTGRTGVFSFARYNPTFFGSPPSDNIDEKLLYSACKVKFQF
jgi:archaemetzincin